MTMTSCYVQIQRWQWLLVMSRHKDDHDFLLCPDTKMTVTYCYIQIQRWPWIVMSRYKDDHDLLYPDKDDHDLLYPDTKMAMTCYVQIQRWQWLLVMSRYKDDPWLWDLDWTVADFRMNKNAKPASAESQPARGEDTEVEENLDILTFLEVSLCSVLMSAGVE